MRIESTSESLADTDTGQNIDVSFDTDFDSQNGLDPVSIETVSRFFPTLEIRYILILC